ncbi:MAG: hypothetical protein ABI679_13045 [Gemmatimonadota bacterium]
MTLARGKLMLVWLSLGSAACGSTDPTPNTVAGAAINDLGPSEYLQQYEGGLYPGGVNVMPTVHDSVGRVRAASIRRLDVNGAPSASGTYVLLSIGMSNATQEWCTASAGSPCDPWTFTGKATADAAVNHTSMVIANGAKGSETADKWDSPTDPNYNRVRDNVLSPLGLTEKQVEIVWLKDADPDPISSLPSASSDAYHLEASLGGIVRALRNRYPNLQMVFLSSRIFAGYAVSTLNPEPYAYESGFSVKWLIEAQISQMANGGTVVDNRAGNLNYNTVAPWIAWGPYLWANGTTARSDGLTWIRSDFESDGTHPSTAGETKVANLLMGFFKGDTHTSCWFLAGATCP